MNEQGAEQRRRWLPAALPAIFLLLGAWGLFFPSAWTQDKEGIIDQRLVGRWVTDPEDAAAIREYGRATQEFEADGRLTYTLHAPDKDYVMLLTYRTEDGVLITDQPSAPQEERTAYRFTPDGRLLLEHEGQCSRYTREDQAQNSTVFLSAQRRPWWRFW